MNVTLAMSAGDPQGIGPEVATRGVRALFEETDEVRVVFAGDPDGMVAAWGEPLPSWPSDAAASLIPVPFFGDGAPPPSAAGGRAALAAVDAALGIVESGAADALVTAPLSKEAVAMERPGFVGHTGYLGRRAGVLPVMLLTADRLRVFLATEHVALRDVAAALDEGGLRHVLTTAHEALRERFDIAHPRLAVLGLNPHAGEGGELGDEEIRIIDPTLRELGGEVGGYFGPFPADSFFVPGRYDRFHGIVAMYHDQGLIPLKTLGLGKAVNVTVGLPYVRTSPDHGTAFDLAGTGQADHASVLEALRYAVRLSRRPE